MGTDAVQSTHYDGCWRNHHICAVLEVERLQAELTAVQIANAVELANASLQLAALRDDNELLKQALVDVQVSDTAIMDTKDRIELYALRGKVAALRPWADVGKRAVRERWFATWERGLLYYQCCDRRANIFTPSGGKVIDHAHDCPIPALLAELEADDARK